jgi:hypothetical protein
MIKYLKIMFFSLQNVHYKYNYNILHEMDYNNLHQNVICLSTDYISIGHKSDKICTLNKLHINIWQKMDLILCIGELNINQWKCHRQ